LEAGIGRVIKHAKILAKLLSREFRNDSIKHFVTDDNIRHK
jgi:hypothetical protein